MAYHGVKFKTRLVDKKIPKDSRLKELKYWCKKFHDLKLAPPYKGGSYGNLSFRIKKGLNQFVITGTKIGLKDCLADNCFVRVSEVDLNKGIVYSHGVKFPSSESMLHFAVYKARPDANAVFHGHSKEILRNSKKLLHLPVTVKKEPYGTLKLVKSVLDSLGDNNLIIMKGHGFLSLGKTMQKAGKNLINLY